MNPVWGFQCPRGANDLPLLETLAGGHVSIAGMYMSSWSNGAYVPFPQSRLDAIWVYGAQPMLTWELRDAAGNPKAQPDWSYTAILSGRHDAYITQFAKDCAAWGNPLWLRIFHELDGDWSPWGLAKGCNGNTPQQHRDAWARIVGVFRAVGTSNVKFVWCPDSYNLSNNKLLEAALPDLGLIDWLSFDSYNFGAHGPHGWRTAATMVDRTMGWFAKIAPATPVVISEIGCIEEPASGDKGAWITDMAATLGRYPQLQAVLWMHDIAPGGRNNRIDSSPGATAAWQSSITAQWSPGYVNVQPLPGGAAMTLPGIRLES